MNIHWIGFDADDTLWENERLYRQARARFNEILAAYGVRPATADPRVDQIEIQNLDWYGYGAMSFGLSLIEAAVELTQSRISGKDVGRVLQLIKDMLAAEVELLEGAEQALVELSVDHPLLLITKGDPKHQHSKLDRSGLRRHFRQVEVVADKTPATYAEIFTRHAIEPERFLMVGNSLKSDALPVVGLGGWAVHVPSALPWAHEQAEAPTALRDRVHQIGSLAELPGWVRDREVGVRALAAEIEAAMQAVPVQNTPSMRQVRRAFSKRIRSWRAEQVLQLAEELLNRPGMRWIGYEMLRAHPGAFRSLGPESLERLGQGIDSWESVDTFARVLAGPVWLRGQIPDALIDRWAHSPDLWWRRAALVSTVALNAKVDKGPGDVPRTLHICRLLVNDREDMVVKALSWALRELVPHDRAALEAFLIEHGQALAARVKREVRNKLRTGLKTPGRARR